MSATLRTVRGMTGTVRHGAIDEQLGELTRWVASPDARAAAAADLGRYGLPTGSDHVDDVLHDVWLRIHGRILREPLEDRGDRSSVVPYARRAVQHAVLDLASGGRAESLDRLVDAGWEPEPVDVQGDDGAAAEAFEPDGDAAFADDVRRSLFARIGDRYVDDWVVAASLVPVVLQDGETCPDPSIPQPARRSRGWPYRHLWAGLAYARQDRCFEEPETGAVRQRRSNAIARVERRLREAIHVAREEQGVRS